MNIIKMSCVSSVRSRKLKKTVWYFFPNLIIWEQNITGQNGIYWQLSWAFGSTVRPYLVFCVAAKPWPRSRIISHTRSKINREIISISTRLKDYRLAFGIITLVYRKKQTNKNYHELSLVSVYDIISTRRTSLNKERANKQDFIESYVFY